MIKRNHSNINTFFLSLGARVIEHRRFFSRYIQYSEEMVVKPTSIQPTPLQPMSIRIHSLPNILFYVSNMPRVSVLIWYYQWSYRNTGAVATAATVVDDNVRIEDTERNVKHREDRQTRLDSTRLNWLTGIKKACALRRHSLITSLSQYRTEQQCSVCLFPILVTLSLL